MRHAIGVQCKRKTTCNANAKRHIFKRSKKKWVTGAVFCPKISLSMALKVVKKKETKERTLRKVKGRKRHRF
eukprot:UN24423